MELNNILKIFISYAHEDNKDDSLFIEKFKKHISQLENISQISCWYDRNITAGKEHGKIIEDHLENSDIICYFISVNFLNSKSCNDELNRGIELQNLCGVRLIPIILNYCGWKDDKRISRILALPTDGKPIKSFENEDEGWNDVYEHIKQVISEEQKIRQLILKQEFQQFLQDTSVFTKAHSQKENVVLDDIYIPPELDSFDELRENEKIISSEVLLKNLLIYPKIVIAGDEQSSKTTLCKRIYRELRNRNFIPIYICARESRLSGAINSILQNQFNSQYTGLTYKEIDQNRIIPIIDDFHYTKNKKKQIEQLTNYKRVIMTVDDVFSLNFEDEKLVKSFKHYNIREFKPSLRNKLIIKWLLLNDKGNNNILDENERYKEIDKTTELIDSSLGKIIGNGIMPAYPFYILTIASTYEIFTKPLNQEITSQGHCYQALIYILLRKQNVKNEQIDIFINFLTEFAFNIFKLKKEELTKDDFSEFMKNYLIKYNLPIKQEQLIKKLELIKIIAVDSFENYSFIYPYLYYFFVGKYLADHIEEERDTIKKILKEIHIEENAYISIFISHHTRNTFVLDEILANAKRFFNLYQPIELTKKELSFFDSQIEYIIDVVLPPGATTPEKERKKQLEIQDQIEEEQKITKTDTETNTIEEIEIRDAIKTVEVIGGIIKNRPGSLERKKLEKLFEEAMDVHLRLLSGFLEIIEKPDQTKLINDFIIERLEKIICEKKITKDRKEIEKTARTIFWNINFMVVYGILSKMIHSLGSENLIDIIEKVCKERNTPATMLTMHGILMWYSKNLQIMNISKEIERKDFSEIARRVMKFMVVSHCMMHKITWKDQQKIVTVLRIPKRRLLEYKEEERNQEK